MTISTGQLILISASYLLTLFLAAWLAERGWIPRRLVRHPLTYSLSLGIYTSAWAFYGAVGLAYQHGHGFLTIYLGLAGAFMLAPVLLQPVLKLSRTHQLASLPDLFAFRFRSTAAGTLTTLGLILCSLPLLALQIQAVSRSAQILTGENSQHAVALVFCILIALFTLLFGARHIASREKHEGIVFVMALESVLKLLALTAIGGFALFYVFNGPTDLQHWLQSNQALLEQIQTPLQEGQWRMLLLLFFAAALVMPHMFHMMFAENLNPSAMHSASWGLPLFLLLMSLPVPLILWASLKLGVTTPPEYFTLGLGFAANQPTLVLLAFMGGLSAASGVIVILTLALSGMALNHLVLPLYQPPASRNIYQWLKWVRRSLIFALILAGYGFYLLLDGGHGLSQLGTTAFAGGLQFLPAVLALLYWPKASRSGFVCGILVGLYLWGTTQLLPMLGLMEQASLAGLALDYFPGEGNWHLTLALCLSANVAVFVLVSLMSHTSGEEMRSRQACLVNRSQLHDSRSLLARSPQDFASSLTSPLGAVIAQREVEQALRELKLPFDESRAFALRRLRDRIEANLSGLFGPSVARDLVNSFIPFRNEAQSYVTGDIHFIESQLEDYRSRMTGLAAELDTLRRYHRQILQDLPLGICSLSPRGEILIWNRAMENLTGITASRVSGSELASIDPPWRELLLDFWRDTQLQSSQRFLPNQFGNRWLNLHKAAIAPPSEAEQGGQVLLLEDITENRQLEDRLIHTQRLASLGRMAAGVAHEIGNPVTGIACLAQIVEEERPDDSELQEISGQIIEQTRRITGIVQSMMNFSHSGADRSQGFATLDWENICKDAVNLLSLDPEARPVDFVNQCNPLHQIRGDAQRLQQVLVNLLGNARDASPAGSRITLETRVTRNSVVLVMSDRGHGISPEHQSQLFEPFFTTKDPGKGTGLGLSMVYAIIKEHQGEIRVESPYDSVACGTRFYIQLPRHLQQ